MVPRLVHPHHTWHRTLTGDDMIRNGVSFTFDRSRQVFVHFTYYTSQTRIHEFCSVGRTLTHALYLVWDLHPYRMRSSTRMLEYLESGRHNLIAIFNRRTVIQRLNFTQLHRSDRSCFSFDKVSFMTKIFVGSTRNYRTLQLGQIFYVTMRRYIHCFIVNLTRTYVYVKISTDVRLRLE
jgi:hypothetical protein